MEGKYVQMTLNDWMALKGQLEAELRGAAAGFVRIGFLLRKIEETKGYENDGSKSLAEWAKDNYGLSATAVSRFMAINRKYSIDGYSERLKPEYIEYGSAKLSEMLALPDKDLEMVSPEMKREDIREIKKFSKEAEKEEIAPAQKETQDIVSNNVKTDSAIAVEPHEEHKEPPAAPELPNVLPEHQWIIEFFKANKEIMNDLYSSKAYEEGNTEGMKEIVNPAGARTFRHKMIMVSMMESRIMVKVSVKSPAPMSWAGFFQIAADTFEGKIDGKNTYRNVFGEDGDAKNAAEATGNPKNAAEPKKAEPAAGGHKAEQNEHFSKENGQIPVQSEYVSENTGKKEPEPGTNTIALAQKENPPATVGNSENPDSAIAEITHPEEPEQVEIDEILPVPVEPDPMRDLKDRFMAEINSLKIMLDCENFSGMTQIIERLEELTARMAILAATTKE